MLLPSKNAYPSECQFQAELNLPGRTEVPARRSRRRDAAKVRGGDRAIRLAKIRVIQNVERLRAELDVDAFRDSRDFRKRHIDILESRALDNVASRVAEATR